MTNPQDRRAALRGFGIAAGAALAATSLRPAGAAAKSESMVEPGAKDLRALMERLAKAPRRRDFKSVPMVLDDPAQWDNEALREVMAYKPVPKQVWDNSVIEGGWLALMHNSLNTQVWSFKHPDFLAVSLTHGTANVALYDAAMWEKYQLTKLAGEKFKTNTLIEAKPLAPATGDKPYENPKGIAGAKTIPALMARGVVFMSCHNAIWEQAGKLIEKEVNPDKLSQDALAAELTNHLIEGVVLTPGAVATIPELQEVGFHYIK